MSKILAFDIGEKRIGIAHSDDSGVFAFPLLTIDASGTAADELAKVIQDKKPEKIIVGLPRNMDGTIGFQAERVRNFVEINLAKYKEIVKYEDESVTSIEAEKVMKLEGKDPRKNKELIDAYAAKIILESYLSK